jgi:hypothetical protein
MTVTVTVRPGARTEIRGLPWGRPGEGYEIIGEAIRASRRGQVEYAHGAFTVARSHTVELIEALAARYGRVQVIHHGGLTKCVAECWRARPDTAYECECSCAGANHGSKHPLGRIVSENGPAGELSVASEGARVYDVFG